jgi:hypothetical protein
MNITEALTDGAERITEQLNDNTTQGIDVLNAAGAKHLIGWVRDRHDYGEAEAAKHLVNAGVAFLTAASVAGLSLESAFRELCLQAEEKVGGVYLTEYERDIAHGARENAETLAATNDQEYARQLLQRMFSNVPAFSRTA